MIPEKVFDDTIPVRPDELFEVEKVADFCRGRVPGSDNPLQVRQFGGQGQPDLPARLWHTSVRPAPSAAWPGGRFGP